LPARPVARAAVLRFIVRCVADQTAFSEPDVRFEAHCGLNSNIAAGPKSANSRHRACAGMTKEAAD
jgi:hypothetical protein